MESYKAINYELIQRNNLLNTKLAQQRVEIVQLNRELMETRKQSALLKRTIQEVITVNSANYNRLVGMMLTGRDSAGCAEPPDEPPRQQQQQQQKRSEADRSYHSHGNSNRMAQEQRISLHDHSHHTPKEKGPTPMHPRTPKEPGNARVVLHAIDQNTATSKVALKKSTTATTTHTPKELCEARVVLRQIDPNVMAQALQHAVPAIMLTPATPNNEKHNKNLPEITPQPATRMGKPASNLPRPCHVRSLSPFLSDDSGEDQTEEEHDEEADDADEGVGNGDAGDCSGDDEHNETGGSQQLEDHGLSVIAEGEEQTMAEQSRCAAETEQDHSHDDENSTEQSVAKKDDRPDGSILHSSESVDQTNASKTVPPHSSNQSRPLLSMTDDASSDAFANHSQVLYSPSIVLHRLSGVSDHQVASGGAVAERTVNETNEDADDDDDDEIDDRSLTLLPSKSQRSSDHISGFIATRNRSAAASGPAQHSHSFHLSSPPPRSGYTLTHPNVSPADASMMSMLSSAISSTPRQTMRQALAGAGRPSAAGGRRSRYSGASGVNESFEATGSRVMRSGRVHNTITNSNTSNTNTQSSSAEQRADSRSADSSLTRTGRPKRKAAPRNLKEETLKMKKRDTRSPPRAKSRK